MLSILPDFLLSWYFQSECDSATSEYDGQLKSVTCDTDSHFYMNFDRNLFVSAAQKVNFGWKIYMKHMKQFVLDFTYVIELDVCIWDEKFFITRLAKCVFLVNKWKKVQNFFSEQQIFHAIHLDGVITQPKDQIIIHLH